MFPQTSGGQPPLASGPLHWLFLPLRNSHQISVWVSPFLQVPAQTSFSGLPEASHIRSPHKCAPHFPLLLLLHSASVYRVSTHTHFLAGMLPVSSHWNISFMVAGHGSILSIVHRTRHIVGVPYNVLPKLVFPFGNSVCLLVTDTSVLQLSFSLLPPG